MKHLSLTPRTGHLTPGQKVGDNYQPNGMIHEKYLNTNVLRDFGMKEIACRLLFAFCTI